MGLSSPAWDDGGIHSNEPPISGSSDGALDLTLSFLVDGFQHFLFAMVDEPSILAGGSNGTSFTALVLAHGESSEISGLLGSQ